MRKGIAILFAAVLMAGCAGQQSGNGPTPKPIITADLRPVGKVVLVNANARFAVVSFPAGSVPQPGQMLAVFHNGLKDADLRITGPQHDNITVGDIMAGTPQAHDEVRPE